MYFAAVSETLILIIMTRLKKWFVKNELFADFSLAISVIGVIILIPYENDIDKLQTYDEWYKFQGVTTFPVLRHTNGLANTG